MRARAWAIAGLLIVLCAMAAVVVRGDRLAESEPNDTPANANPLDPRVANEGAIDPAGDVDYYAIPGVNRTWGFIALLETISSTTQTGGTLTAYRNDGTTVLQADTGSWELGSGIALQNYADGGQTLYLRVSEPGNDGRITPYTIRHYPTVVATQPEVEPNGTLATGTPSSFTHNGVVSPTGDVDCFAFHGRLGDRVLLALNGDPEGDGSTADLSLRLLGPDGTQLKVANQSGLGGKEFIEYELLPTAGVYAYCVQTAGGSGGAGATYRVGIVRRGTLYFPELVRGPDWLNPRPGRYARVGDELRLRLVITNASPLGVPGDISLSGTYSPSCLSLVRAEPAPSYSSTGSLSWEGQKVGLAAGEMYSVSLRMRALRPCSDVLYQSTQVEYYFTGYGNTTTYLVTGAVRLPLITRRR